jgi:UDP-N-acetylglucosamine--N-acetylmuramyl-(pentapeptide) pyrophosphoryl-undecaprenol N-acetylglucosamine transferase
VLVMIAGGGTGGHVYPGLAVANALKALSPEIDIEFVGSRGGMEAKLVPQNGYKIHLIPVGKIMQGGVFYIKPKWNDRYYNKCHK